MTAIRPNLNRFPRISSIFHGASGAASAAFLSASLSASIRLPSVDVPVKDKDDDVVVFVFWFRGVHCGVRVVGLLAESRWYQSLVPSPSLKPETLV